MKKVPELRFPEFKDEWKEDEIRELVSFHKGRNLSKSDLAEDGTPCILYGELYTKYNEVIETVHSKTNSNKKLVMSKRNDVLLPSSGETALDISSASVVMVEGIALGGDLNILRPKKDLDGRFLSYSLNSAKKTDLARVAQGNSVVHLYSSEIGKVKMHYPSLSEQHQIADFFSTLDSRIEIQEEKINNLEEQKKGYMQRIFSQEIRFKDDNGEDYPGWEEKRLGNLCNITTGKLDANAMVEGGKYPFFTCAKEMYFINIPAFDTEALLIAGNGDVGHIRYYKGKFNAYQRTYVLDNFKENISYIKYFMDKHLRETIYKELQVGSMPYIKLGTLKEFKLKIPSKEEQQKIAGFLSLFDEKIEIEKEILDTLQEMKRGFLQKMFV